MCVSSESNWGEIACAAPGIVVCFRSDIFFVSVLACVVHEMHVFPTYPDYFVFSLSLFCFNAENNATYAGT